MRSVSEWIEFFRNAPEDAKKEIKELSRKEYYELLCQDGSEKIPYAETQLHCHTDLGSPKDSVLRVDDYVRVNKTLHTDTASVTDHGTMYGIPFVYDAFQSNKMKLIVGLEAYLCDDVEDHNMKTHTRLHLILYAKDNLGYQGLSDLVTRSNYRILETKGGSFPCVSKQMLEELCGPGKIYHGHIIATSACVGGVLAGIGYANETNQKNLEVINGKIQKLTRLLDSYQTLNTELQTSTSVFQEHSKASSQEEVNRISSILKSMKKHPEDYSDEERAKANKESDRITQLRSQLPSKKKRVRGKQHLRPLPAELSRKISICLSLKKKCYITGICLDRSAGTQNFSFMESKKRQNSCHCLHVCLLRIKSLLLLLMMPIWPQKIC